MKVEPPRTAVDPLATVLAQIAAGRTPDPLAVHALRQMLPAATVAGILQGKPHQTPIAVAPITPARALDATESLQRHMPKLTEWDGATLDDYEPAAARRGPAGDAVPSRSAPQDGPLLAQQPVAPEPATPAPPGPVEARRVTPDPPPQTRRQRAEDAARKARARAAKIWIVRGPVTWIGVSLLLTLAAFTLL
ncbi:MAG: hypothetical protein JWL93_1692 [Hyphomicrobiales bacterium]|nr:hypothetical protein [Hyphomicrobiales bacterium]